MLDSIWQRPCFKPLLCNHPPSAMKQEVQIFSEPREHANNQPALTSTRCSWNFLLTVWSSLARTNIYLLWIPLLEVRQYRHHYVQVGDKDVA